VAIRTGKQPSFRFQAIDSRNILHEKRVAFFNPKGFAFNKEPGLMLPEKLDAIHEDGQLFFRSERKVSRFLDLGDVFREATSEELKAVFSKPEFVVDNWLGGSRQHRSRYFDTLNELDARHASDLPRLEFALNSVHCTVDSRLAILRNHRQMPASPLARHRAFGIV
jgi:hypothetical protein